MSKKEITEKEATAYLKRVKLIGVFGIIFSIALIAYDIIEYTNWMNALSLVIDVFLLLFSIYFIVKSSKLKNNEKNIITKNKSNNKTK